MAKDFVLCVAGSGADDHWNGAMLVKKALHQLNDQFDIKVDVRRAMCAFNALDGKDCCYVFLGPEALKFATPGRTPSLVDARRQVNYNANRQPWTATYSAELAVSSPQWLAVMVEDCFWVRSAHHTKVLPAIQPLSLPTKSKIIGWDIETDGELASRHAKILTSAWSDGTGTAGSYLPTSNVFMDTFIPTSTILAGHGIKYDLAWWEKLVGPVRNRLHCTEIAEGLLNDNVTDNSLAFLVSRYTDISYYKGMVDRSRLALAPQSEVMVYNKYDAIGSAKVASMQRMALEEQGLMPVFEFSMDMVRVFAGIETTGVYIDKDWAYERGREVTRLRDEAIAATGMTLAELHSTNAMSVKLFEERKLPIVGYTPTGKACLKKEMLEEIYARTEDPVVKAIMDFRRYDKLYSTYYVPVPQWTEHDGRVHTSYALASGEFGGTKTGRTSSRNPNLQNIPKSKSDRGMFAATPGWRWADADYSQLELRVAADLSRDPVMLGVFYAGRDIHTDTMLGFCPLSYEEVVEWLASGDEAASKLRRGIKCINFGILYGVGAKTLMKLSADAGDRIDAETAQQRIRKWRGRYPGVAKWMEDTEDFAIKHGYVTMPSGRRRHVPDAGRGTPTGMRALRQCTNAPIQGTASDITLTAMYLLNQRLHPLDARLLLNVHDQIGLEFRPEAYTDDDIRSIITKVMVEEVPEEFEARFGYKIKVPLGIDISIGERWS